LVWKRLLSILIAIVMSCSAISISAISVSDTPAAWAAKDIEKAISLGFVPTSLQNAYAQPITRAEFCALAVTFYEIMMGAIDEEDALIYGYKDTFDMNVKKAALIGVVNGVGDGKFDPDSGITREQAATMLSRLAGATSISLPESEVTFSDISDISTWANDAVGQMQASGIMQGVGDNSFAPKERYQRQQSIVTILRLFEMVNPDVDPYYLSWALGCSAIIATNNRADPHQFGTLIRSPANAAIIKTMLSRDWNCGSREDIINTIGQMTDDGHNASFAEAYEIVNSLTKSEYEALLALSSDMDKYMWPLTKSIGDKWGDKQIKAWDWFRMVHLAGWGYVAGYIQLEEAYELMQPIIDKLRSTFSSWEEACDNYMDGYAWWSRTDVSQTVSEYKNRLKIYQDIKEDLTLFNPSVWE
ncbi:MAG: DUF1266 domain-containing protein, partial [Oscillospiraceae bacterium]|nr:DUF1266 domain-containing protein [Oscillospiraceae bacterium]